MHKYIVYIILLQINSYRLYMNESEGEIDHFLMHKRMYLIVPLFYISATVHS